jgi:hypothetical protein
MATDQNDICDCGDFRKDHAGGDGGCIFTPDPDHDRTGSDGHFGSGPCYRFRLAREASVPRVRES